MMGYDAIALSVIRGLLGPCAVFFAEPSERGGEVIQFNRLFIEYFNPKHFGREITRGGDRRFGGRRLFHNTTWLVLSTEISDTRSS